MDKEESELLEKTFYLVKENNKILRKMRRVAFWSNMLRLFYWLLIIGLSLGAYYYIQPIVEPIINTFRIHNTETTSENLKTVSRLPTLIDFLK